ncbi:hypothetical protein Bca52824_068768 [Brassica carinata]|uniref:TF-B3 domain-containing protein n=1 Tax=Brassica carinata TaxID=52824 RepID=A0A8X7U1J6_BRACI|nr:hypothetical protein Bca52824_068768 [Brassica carinata]
MGFCEFGKKTSHFDSTEEKKMANSHEPHFFKPLLPDNTTWFLLKAHRREDEPENMETKIGRFRSNLERGTWAMSSFSFDYCFLAEVTASNLKEDKLYLPVGATSSTALNKQYQEMILVHKEGNSWTVSLRFSESGGMYYITRGWRKFCLDNRCEIGDLFVFNLVGDGKTTPLLCKSSTNKFMRTHFQYSRFNGLERLDDVITKVMRIGHHFEIKLFFLALFQEKHHLKSN